MFNEFPVDYFIISLLLFILGFLDDLKIRINPNIRLILMFCLLVFCINIFSIQITKSGLEFLNQWLENNVEAKYRGRPGNFVGVDRRCRR